MPFSQRIREGKVENIRRMMGEKGIGAALFLRDENVRYITEYHHFQGIKRTPFHSTAVLLTANTGPILIAPKMTLGYAMKKCWAERFDAPPPGNEGLVKFVKEILEKEKIEKGKLGIEKNYLSAELFEVFQRGLKDIKFEDASGPLMMLKAVKFDEEIDIMKRAAEIADTGIEAASNNIREGVRECDVAAAIDYAILKEGADGVNHNSVKSGENTYLVQPFTSRKKLEKGDFVQPDIGAIYEGYTSDITRTFVVGNPSEKQREIFSISLEAEQEAIKAIKPGVKGKEIDAIARDIIAEAGYGEYFPHLTGHGLGTDAHEVPFLDKGVETELKMRMVVTIEPGIYLPEVGGSRTEDMALVTATGHKVLTKFRRDLT